MEATTTDGPDTVTSIPYVNRRLLQRGLDIIKKYGEHSSEIFNFLHKHKEDKKLVELIKAAQMITAKLKNL